MKKVVLIFILIFSSLNLQTASAAENDYDYQTLSEYKGFSETMFESVLEETTFITGRYTENKSYVEKSMNQISDYGQFWMNEKNRLNDSCGGTELLTLTCLGDLTSTGMGYVLTIGDYVKKMFNDYDTFENSSDPNEVLNYEGFDGYFKLYGTNDLDVINGYKIDIFYPDGTVARDSTYIGAYLWYDVTPVISATQYAWRNPYSAFVSNFTKADGSYISSLENWYLSQKGSLNGVLNILNRAGIRYVIKKDGKEVNVKFPSVATKNGDIKTINNYINDGGLDGKQIVTPQPKAYLSCPDGTKIGMTINGSTFLDVNGNVMQVTKEGVATVNSSICNLNWEKPTIRYIGDIPVIEDTEGNFRDIETGERVLDDGEIDDELEDGCGVVCAIGKMLSGLGQIAKSIAGLVTNILDGLLSLVVPKNLDFVTESFNNITSKLNEKIGVTEQLKGAITGLFDGGESNPLENIEVNLPASDKPLKFGDVSLIETGVPILRKVISAIVVLYTILYVYRKIVGRGGVMEK